MGIRAAGKRLLRLRTMAPLVVAASAVVLAAAVPAGPAQAAQANDGVPAEAAPPGQSEPGPPGAAPGVCEHAPGEFLVGYVSEEALRAAPPENVVETLDGILAQHLAFEEIKGIPDPAQRLAAEEAKRQELAARPGVAYAEYNCVATIQSASAEEAADLLPTPASCGDCGRYVVDRAKKIIADGLGGDAEGTDAFNAALEAARSADAGDDNVAFASEVELDAEDGSSGGSDAGSAGEGNDEDDSEDAGTAGSGSETGSGETGKSVGSDKNAEGEGSAAEEEADDESSSGDTGAGSEGEDTASAAESVSGKNAASTSEPREAGSSGGKVAFLGVGALLLVAGVLVARKTLSG